jgi:hypothetical protein
MSDSLEKKSFTDIYLNKTWCKEHASGHGSLEVNVSDYAQELRGFCDAHKCKSFVDIPCGVYSWIASVTSEMKYYGLDIVQELVAENQRQYPTLDFRVHDLVNTTLPSDLHGCDVLHVKEVMIHLTSDQNLAVLRQIVACRPRFVVLSTFSESRCSSNTRHTEGHPGRFHPVNLELVPFNLPPPLVRFKREMAVWPIESIVGARTEIKRPLTFVHCRLAAFVDLHSFDSVCRCLNIVDYATQRQCLLNVFLFKRVETPTLRILHDLMPSHVTLNPISRYHTYDCLLYHHLVVCGNVTSEEELAAIINTENVNSVERTTVWSANAFMQPYLPQMIDTPSVKYPFLPVVGSPSVHTPIENLVLTPYDFTSPTSVVAYLDTRIVHHMGMEPVATASHIPRIIHMMWLTPSVNGLQNPTSFHSMQDYVKRINPGWEFNMWTSARFNAFLRHKCSMREQQVFDRIPTHISKCDFARMLLLRHYGGVYIDQDFHMIRSFSFATAGRKACFVLEHGIHGGSKLYNGCFACIQQHPFVVGWIEQMIHNLSLPTAARVMITTGPIGFYSFAKSKGYLSDLTIMMDYTTFVPWSWMPLIHPKQFVRPICATRWKEGTAWRSDNYPVFEFNGLPLGYVNRDSFIAIDTLLTDTRVLQHGPPPAKPPAKPSAKPPAKPLTKHQKRVKAKAKAKAKARSMARNKQKARVK